MGEIVIQIPGAFEGVGENLEKLWTLSRTGHVPRQGDKVGIIDGLQYLAESDSAEQIQINPDGLLVLNFVNKFGSTDCDKQIVVLEELRDKFNDIPVYSISMQTTQEMSACRTIAPAVRHPRVLIDKSTAIDLGVALIPGEGADKEFWTNATRRGVIVLSKRKIQYAEFNNDQAVMPNYGAAFLTASRLSSQIK